MTNSNNNFLDFNFRTLEQMKRKEMALSILLEDKETLSLDFDDKFKYFYNRFSYLREDLLIYFHYISNYFNGDNDSSFDNHSTLAKECLSYKVISSNLFFSLFETIESKNSRTKIPFRASINTAEIPFEIYDLIDLFGEDFIHKEIIALIKQWHEECSYFSSNNDIDDEDEEIEYDYYEMREFFALESSYLNFTNRPYNTKFEFNKSYFCDDNELESFIMINALNIYNTSYINLHSDLLSNFLEHNLNNQEVLNSFFTACKQFIFCYYSNVISLSTPIIIDKSSNFHKGNSKYELLIACITDPQESEVDYEIDYIGFKSITEMINKMILLIENNSSY